MNQQREEPEIKTQNSVFLVCKCQATDSLLCAANPESFWLTEKLENILLVANVNVTIQISRLKSKCRRESQRAESH